MYPNPNLNGATISIDGYELAPDDYLNYERTNPLGETVCSGCYITDVDPAEGTVTLFNLREEKKVTHTAEELADALGKTLHHTGETWTGDDA